MPEISEIRNYEQMRFLCDDDKNLGIPNYLFLVPLVLLDKRMNFVQLNMELTEELERYLEKTMIKLFRNIRKNLLNEVKQPSILNMPLVRLFGDWNLLALSINDWNS
jgi:hypothetical protein